MPVHYKFRIPEYLVQFVRGLHPQIKRKLRVSLKAIASDPYSGKPLKDELDGLRSFRVSKFRIIYAIASKKEIQIIAVGPRKHIYEETYRIIRKETQGG